MNIGEIAEILTSGSGVSGAEFTMDKAKELLSHYAHVSTDNSGNIIGTVGNGKKHILLDAHLDRIGLIVTGVDKSGFLRVDKCGGCDARTLSAAEVTIYGKKTLYGVVTSTPPHLAKAEDKGKVPDFDNIYVDTGLPYEKISNIVSVGDRITIDSPVIKLQNNRISGSALDDRIGMAALLRVLDILKDKELKKKVTVLFSVQEETTECGAKTGSFSIDPDEAIAVDVSFAKAPDIEDSECGKLGDGGMICISPSISCEMSSELIDIAQSEGIKYQTEVCPGNTGTNADVIAISKSGVKTGLISVPQRNMHTQAEIVDLDDVEAVAQLIAAYILKGED